MPPSTRQTSLVDRSATAQLRPHPRSIAVKNTSFTLVNNVLTHAKPSFAPANNLFTYASQLTCSQLTSPFIYVINIFVRVIDLVARVSQLICCQSLALFSNSITGGTPAESITMENPQGVGVGLRLLRRCAVRQFLARMLALFRDFLQRNMFESRPNQPNRHNS